METGSGSSTTGSFRENDSARAEAERLIAEALGAGSRRLSLAGLRIADVPESVTRLAPLLEELDLSGCRRLVSVGPLAGLGGLQSIDLGGCVELRDLSALAGLSGLQSLDLSWCVELRDLSALVGLSCLQRLALNECRELRDLSALAGLSGLQSLGLGGCGELRDLSALAGLGGLQSLDLSFCRKLRDVSALSGLSGLRSLDLSGCRELRDGSTLAGLSGLQILSLRGCRELRDLGALAGLSSLQSLDLRGCDELRDLSALAGLSSLRSLDLVGCRELRDVSALAGLSGLQSLDLGFCGKLRDVSALAGLTGLQSLGLSFCGALRDLSALVGLSGLQSLDLSGRGELRDVSALAGLSGLQSLDLSGCVELRDVSALAGLGGLQSLDLGGCGELRDLSSLAGLSGLQSLYLGACRELRDVSALADLSDLQRLDLGGCVELRDLSALAGLSGLRSLHLSGCGVLRDVSALAGLSGLQSLDLSGCGELRDVSALAGLSGLQSLDLSRCDELRDLSALAGLIWLTTLRVVGTAVGGLVPDDFANRFPRLSGLIADALSAVPPELCSDGLSENCLVRLERWHDELAASGAAKADSVKLFVLGNGRAGKTQIVRRLRGENFDPTVPSTHGIQSCRLQILAGAGPDKPLYAQVWDFGGQDIYLGTHSLFLDARAIHVLVWTPATENDERVEHQGMLFRNQTLHEWLDYVRALVGPGAPVLVIQSQCDRESQRREPPMPPEHGFGWLQRTACSAAAPEGMDRAWPELRAAARLLQERHGETLLPRSWVRVSEQLRLAKESGLKVMPRAQFDALCQAQGVGAIATTLRYLHQAGEVFSLPGVFDGDVILDQAWALQGLYALLHRDRVLPVLRQQGGHFTQDLLAGLLWDGEGHTAQEQAHFLSLMQRCGVCFELGDGHYLAPDCLPERADVSAREAALWRGAEPACRVELRYAALHQAVLRSQVSALGRQAGLQAAYWRYGAAFYDAGQRSAIRIYVERPEAQPGSTRSGAGALVLEAAEPHAGAYLQRLADQLVGGIGLAQQPAQVWVRGAPGDGAARHGADRGIADRSDPAQAPPLIEAALPPPLPGQAPRVHVSYAWGSDSEAFVDALEAELEGCCEWRRDKRSMRPGDWISQFMDEIGFARCVVIVISDKYLKSHFCMRELLGLFQTSRGHKRQLLSRIVPVVLADAQIGSVPQRMARVRYWKEAYEANQKSVEGLDDADKGSEFVQEQQHITEFRTRVADILAWVTDELMPRPQMPKLHAGAAEVAAIVRDRVGLPVAG